MNKLSLRLRITILMGVLLVALTTALTIVSIMSVNHFFVAPHFQENAYEQMDKAVQDGTAPDCSLIVPDASGNGSISNNPETPAQIIIAQRDFSVQSIVVLLAIIAVGLGITYWVMGRALRPLTTLSETIHDINAHNLSKPIAGHIANDEVGSLTASFNAMLERLQATFEQQKHFSASAAHELKTPLATMKTSLQVLRMDDSPSADDYRDTLAVLEQNVDRLIATVNDLLLLSSEGITELDDEISLRGLFCEIADELKEALAQKNLRCTLPQNDFLIAGNYMLLHSAFFNLFDNAVKYNKAGGLVDVTLQEAPDGKTAVSIHDTGIGMSEEDAQMVFNPFYRADHACAKGIAGNGLGMSIVRTIIEEHAGTIQVESKLNAGTKVTAVLPPLQKAHTQSGGREDGCQCQHRVPDPNGCRRGLAGLREGGLNPQADGVHKYAVEVQADE